MMLDSPEDVETDAVHHRLQDNVVTVRDVTYTYGCYDCVEQFPTLEELAAHSHRCPPHSVESCLLCSKSITVFYSSRHTVRLHSCSRNFLKHQNTDMKVLAQDLFRKLDLTEDDETSVFCQLCPKSFQHTPDGFYKFLKHSNRHMHTTVPNCKKCTLPEFKLVLYNSHVITHFCPKIGKSVAVKRI
jgi:hypothetical protein